MDCDVAIVGAGMAGTCAATLLSRTGLRVVLIDSKRDYPPCFKAEKFGEDQAQRLRRFKLIDVLIDSATAIHEVQSARRARIFRRYAVEHYGVAYHNLVNSFRRALPLDVDFRIGAICDVSTATETQRLSLSDGSQIEARLLVLACGAGNGLPRQLGLRSRILSRLHSVTAGFSMAPAGGRPLAFDELMYYSDRTEAGVAFLTLFPMGAVLRGNLFTYWDAGDERMLAFRADPLAWLDRWMTGLTEITGPLRLTEAAECRPVNLRIATDFLRPGMVLLGDAYLVACPASGRGVSKALNDVERLCHHAPRWLSTPGMALDKISQFYDDPLKRQFDLETLEISMRMRKTAVDLGIWWRLRRGLRAWKWAANGLWLGKSAGV